MTTLDGLIEALQAIREAEGRGDLRVAIYNIPLRYGWEFPADPVEVREDSPPRAGIPAPERRVVIGRDRG